MATKKSKVKPTSISAAKHVTRRVTAPGKIVLDANIKISNVQELKTLLRKFLSRKQITINASKVEKIDTSVMQLLTAFIMETDSRSIKINWQSPSPYLVNSARLLGLIDSIKLPTDLRN